MKNIKNYSEFLNEAVGDVAEINSKAYDIVLKSEKTNSVQTGHWIANEIVFGKGKIKEIYLFANGPQAMTHNNAIIEFRLDAWQHIDKTEGKELIQKMTEAKFDESALKTIGSYIQSGAGQKESF